MSGNIWVDEMEQLSINMLIAMLDICWSVNHSNKSTTKPLCQLNYTSH